MLGGTAECKVMTASKSTGLLDGSQEVGEDGLGDAVPDDGGQHGSTLRAGDEVTATRLSEWSRAGLTCQRPAGPETEPSLKRGSREFLLQNISQRYPAFLPPCPDPRHHRPLQTGGERHRAVSRARLAGGGRSGRVWSHRVPTEADLGLGRGEYHKYREQDSLGHHSTPQPQHHDGLTTSPPVSSQLQSSIINRKFLAEPENIVARNFPSSQAAQSSPAGYHSSAWSDWCRCGHNSKSSGRCISSTKGRFSFGKINNKSRT